MNGGYLFDNSAKGGYGGAVYMKDGSGAGICVKGKSSNAMLTMNGGYICANRNEVSCGIAGHQKEGAGISIREVGAIVQNTSGYINNNSLEQSQDWGVRGIFCTEGT